MHIERPGIYTDIAVADYFADPCPTPSLNQTLAHKLLDRSPKHAWCEHPKLSGEEPEPEEYFAPRAIGNAVHRHLLGRGKELAVCIFKDWRTAAAQAARDEAIAQGRMPILEKHHERALGMVEVARRKLDQMKIKIVGDTEVVLAWRERNLWFRSLVDCLSFDRRIVIDIKTTGRSCAAQDLGRLMAEAGWPMQAAMHERGLDVLDPGGAGQRHHLFIAQENVKPFELVVVEPPESAMVIGRKQLDMAIKLWAMCMQADQWPGYPSQVVSPDYPGYAEAQWLEREIKDAANERVFDNILAGG